MAQVLDLKGRPVVDGHAELARDMAKPHPWERQLRVTLTLDISVPDDRTLAPKIKEALAQILRQGVDNTPGRSHIVVEDTLVVVHHHFINRYFDHGKLLKREGGEEGGAKAPEMKP